MWCVALAEVLEVELDTLGDDACGICDKLDILDVHLTAQRENHRRYTLRELCACLELTVDESLVALGILCEVY